MAEPTISDMASEWLREEIEAGRLTPTMSEEQLAAVASVLIASAPRSSKQRRGRPLPVADRTSSAPA